MRGSAVALAIAALSCLSALVDAGQARAATTVDTTGCPASSISMQVMPGDLATTGSCSISFGDTTGTAVLRLYQQDGVGTAMTGLSDYQSGAATWGVPSGPALGASMFGACLLSSSSVTASWSLDSDASCSARDDDPWNAVPRTNAAPGSLVGTTSSVGATGTLGLRFGARAAASQAAGAYTAPLVIEVLSAVVNNAPIAPSLVTPLAADVATAAPTLTATFNDADAGQAGTLAFEVRQRVAGACSTSGTLMGSGNSASIVAGANGSWNYAGTALVVGTTYCWRAMGTDAASAAGPWSSLRAFTINTAPTAPTLVTPSAATTVASATPLLTATFNDADATQAGTVSFEVRQRVAVACSTGGTLMGSGSSASTVAGANGTWTYTGTALVAGTTYCWRAMGTDALAAASPWSSLQAFTVNSAPTAPTLVTPAAAATVASSTPLLTATFNDADTSQTGTLSFEVRAQVAAACSTSGTLMGSGSSASTVAGANGSWTYTGTALVAGTTYCWRAMGTDALAVASAWSGLQAFTINSVPTAPTLVTPTAAATVASAPLLTATFNDPDAAQTGTLSFEVRAQVAAACSTSGTLMGSGSSASVVAGANGSWTYAGTALVAGTTYCWRAMGTDALAAASGWSGLRAFTVNSAPTAPTLVSPTAGATVASATPLLTATFSDVDAAQTGTLSFEVRAQVAAACSTGGTLMGSGTSASTVAGTNGSWTYTGTALAAGTTYCWRAMGTDALAATSPWSSLQAFTANSAPTAPTLVSPTAAATVGSATPVLTATFNDVDGGQTGTLAFEVRQRVAGACSTSGTLMGSGSSGSVAAGANGSWTYTGTALVTGTTYCWRAMGTDVASAAGPWSGLQAFTINSAPTAPTLVTPASAATVASSIPLLTATFNDADASQTGTLSFEVRAQVAAACSTSGTLMGSGSSASVVASANGSWTYTGTALVTGTTYCWRAMGTDALATAGPWSSLQAFTVNSAPTAPTLVTPTANATVGSSTPLLTATFNDADATQAGTLSFEVRAQVAAACSTSGTLMGSGSSASVVAGANGSWTYTGTALVAGTTYCWRAMGTDALAATSPWSGLRAFTVNSAPTAPTLVSPTAGATVASATPLLTATFNDADATQTGTLNFEVRAQVAAACSTSGTLMGSGTSASTAAGANGTWTYTGTTLSPGTIYCWRAVATDALAAAGPWSSLQDFTINSAPTAPTLVTPAAAASVSSTTPGLTATFNDADVGQTGTVSFEVRAQVAAACSTSGTLMGSGTSTSVSAGANASWTYTGTTLVAGTTYCWRALGTDALAATSAWSALQGFTVNVISPSAYRVVSGMELGSMGLPGGSGAGTAYFRQVNGAPTVVSNIARTGAYSLNVDAPSEAVMFDVPSNSPTARFGVYFETLPTASTRVMWFSDWISDVLAVRYDSATGRLTAGVNSDTVAAGPVITAGRWYVVEFGIDTSGANAALHWRVDGATQPDASSTLASSSFNAGNQIQYLWFGTDAGGTGASIYYDDIIHANGTNAFPLGDGRVLPLRPNGMTNIVAGLQNDDGSAVTSASWSRLIDDPMTSIADFLRGASTSGSADVQLQDPPVGTTATAVRGTFTYHASGTSPNNATTSIVYGDASTFTFSSGDFSESTLYDYTRMITPPAAGWTAAELGAAAWRLGPSTDINPVPYWDALLVEADYAFTNTAPGAPAPIAPASGATGVAANPSLSATFADTDAAQDGQVTFEVRARVAGACSTSGTLMGSGTSNFVQAGATASWTYAGTALASAQTYCWRAASTDSSEATGAWSALRPFTRS